MRFLGKRIPKDYNKQTDSLYWTLTWYGFSRGAYTCQWRCGGRFASGSLAGSPGVPTPRGRH